eukprot:598460-Amphidinium_carterae.2
MQNQLPSGHSRAQETLLSETPSCNKILCVSSQNFLQSHVLMARGRSRGLTLNVHMQAGPPSAFGSNHSSQDWTCATSSHTDT